MSNPGQGGYPEVTDGLLAELVSRIRAVGIPKKVVLLGSRARGDARPESDLDVLIIEESEEPRFKRARKYRIALLGLFPSKDIGSGTVRHGMLPRTAGCGGSER